MDVKTKALVSVAASVGANCQSCLQRTVAMATEAGAEKSEIINTINIAKNIRSGAGEGLDEFARTLIDSSGAKEAKSGCGCGGNC